MNLISSEMQQLTMSSREIAELTGKQHSHVKRDIDNMCAEINHPELESSTFEHRGNCYTQYHLDKELTLCLIAGYSAKIRMTIIKRWQELESKQTPQVPQTYAEALQLAADQAKQLELAAHKVAFVDNFVEVGTTKTLRETAKILKYPERKMITLMIEDKVLYRQSGNLLPYQARQSQGLFEVKTGERNGHAFTQTRVTTKGLEWLGSRYAGDLMEGC